MNKISFSSHTNAPQHSSTKAQKSNKYVSKPSEMSGNDVLELSSVSEKPVKKSFLKRLFPYGLAGLMAIGGANACSGPRVNGLDDVDSTKIEYCNVKQETRDSIAVPLLTLKSKLEKDNDFLKGVEVNITNSFEDLDDSHSFKTFLKEYFAGCTDKGYSFYSDKNVPRIIVVQEGAHDSMDKMISLLDGNGYSALPALRHSLMHEVGHQFDEYYGHDHNSRLAERWDSLVYAKEKSAHENPYNFDANDEDMELMQKYKSSCSLSDKNEFQEALLKDYKHIAKIRRDGSEAVACTIDYYLEDINLNNITNEMLEGADYTRSEVYANLFAYAIGENDGDRADFINNFKNSYKVVQKDIAKYLNINVK